MIHAQQTKLAAEPIDVASSLQRAEPPTELPGERAGAQDAQATEAMWTRLQECLRETMRPEQYETWFRRSALSHFDEEVVVLAVQNSFAAQWLENYYRETIEHAVRLLVGGRRRLVLSVDPELTVRRREAPLARARVERLVAPEPPPQQGGLLWNSDLDLNPKYTFDNFVVGPCNRLPHAAAMGVAEAPGLSYNPFFLYGSVGLGKTHLLQSACFMILERRPQMRILYLSCETFVNHFINALQEGVLKDFRHKYRNVDVLVVDDIHHLADKERTQNEFFHTFNELHNCGKQIVLSSDALPSEIPSLHERLISRFKWGMVAEIDPPCFETRTAIVKRKAYERGYALGDEIARMIADRIETNVRELEGAVTRLIALARVTGEDVSTELAQQALRDNSVVRQVQPSLDDVVRLVTAHFNVRVVDLQSKSRVSSIVYPRQVAMYLARKAVRRLSLGEIGGYFGGRDHSTVVYAVDKISKLIQQDESTRRHVEELMDRVGTRPSPA